MAMTFPVPVASLSDRLHISSMSLHLPAFVEESQTAAGEIIRAQLGESLWSGQITLSPASHSEARQFRAMVDLLQRPGASFLLTPHDMWGPISDPDGAILGTAAVTISAVASNSRDLTLAGLPVGYVLQRGDYLSFVYGSSPVRWAFHQVVSDTEVASAGGAMMVEVNAPIRAGWSAGTAVRLFRPQFKAILRQRDPGRSVPVVHDGIAFDFVQTLR